MCQKVESNPLLLLETGRNRDTETHTSGMTYRQTQQTEREKPKVSGEFF